MGLIQQLRNRELSGCGGCDAVRQALYKGMDWFGTKHDSFNASPLGAYLESPVGARGLIEGEFCAFTVSSITDVGSTSISTTAQDGSKTLASGADRIILTRTPSGEEDPDDYAYAFTCTGATSGQSWDFRGTVIDVGTDSFRANNIVKATADEFDLIKKSGVTIEPYIIYEGGNPGWSNGEDVNCECQAGALFGTSATFNKTLENATGDQVDDCDAGLVDVPVGDAFYSKGSASGRFPELSDFGGTPDGYIQPHFVGITGRAELFYGGYFSTTFTLNSTGADFSDFDVGPCWQKLSALNFAFFRVKQTTTADVDGRVNYEIQWISDGHFGTGTGITMQMLGVSEAL